MATTPQIVSVYPAPDARGIVLGDQIKVLFDQEMDETSINSGTFLLVGPDNDFIFGPGFNPLDEPELEDERILNSPHYKGFVQADITFLRIDQYGAETDVVDYEGAGDLYQTLAILTPRQPLAPSVEYEAIVAGDEDTENDYDTGVKTRTVFDTEKISVAGDAEITFGGGFSHPVPKTYFVEITSGGATGQAEYLWWEESSPLTTFPGITTTGRRTLEHGVWIECSKDGNFTTGDTFRVICIPAEVLPNNYKWVFNTGSGAILTPPSDASTTGLVEIGEDSETSEDAFTVQSISPSLRAYGVGIDLEEIVVTFSEAPSPASVTTSKFSVFMTPVNGDPIEQLREELEFSVVLSSSTVATLTLEPDQLEDNKLITIEISGIVDADDGTVLTSYASYFTTAYSPLYTSIRRIRLDLGPVIVNVPNETILLAIYEASLYVDALSFVSAVTNLQYLAFAKRELATCMAELMLLRGGVGLQFGPNMSKTLADLVVSRSGGFPGYENKVEDLEKCIARWSIPVQTGGEVSTETSLKPSTAVKGSLAEDAVGVGREWEPISGIGYRDVPAGNSYSQATARRWVRDFRKRT